MSARPATPRAFPATTSCASPSPSPPSPRRSPPPSPGALADRTPPQQSRQQNKAGDERPAPLPRLHDDLRSRVPVDLPRQIVDPVRIGEARLEKPHHGQQLALELPPAPGALRRLSRLHPHGSLLEAGLERRFRRAGRLLQPPFGHHRFAHAPVAIAIGI